MAVFVGRRGCYMPLTVGRTEMWPGAQLTQAA